MANIIDYIKWRGDLTFEASPFNEVDNLILSKLSYLDFNNIEECNNDTGVSLENVAYIYFAEKRHEDRNNGHFMTEELFELLRVAADSIRFKDIKIKRHMHKIDFEKEMQFCAMTFDLLNNCLYIAYQGTDDTLVGWKEDLKMSIMDVVPAQDEALKYFLDITDEYKEYNYYLGGHSKGGNLAVYSSVYAIKELQDKIVNVYNNDGPGFKESILHTNMYKNIADKIVTIVPQSSVVGMLLEHEEDYRIVRSNKKGLFQHYGFTWEVCGKSFVHLSEADNLIKFDMELKNIINKLAPEQKEEFINTIFEIFENDDHRTLTDIRDSSFKSVLSLVKAYDSLCDDVKKAITGTLSLLFAESIKNNEIKNKSVKRKKVKISSKSIRPHQKKKNDIVVSKYWVKG